MLARSVRVLGVLVVAGVAAMFTPLPNRLAERLAVRGTPAPAGAIVVLGGAANPDGTINNASFIRAVEGVRLYRRGLAPILVLSGSPAETRARTVLARDLGVPPDAIVVERDARTTREEAEKIGARLAARGVRDILLVTDSQHLGRAMPLFERAGQRVIPIAADYVSSSVDRADARVELLRIVAEEAFARVYYRVARYL